MFRESLSLPENLRPETGWAVEVPDWSVSHAHAVPGSGSCVLSFGSMYDSCTLGLQEMTPSSPHVKIFVRLTAQS